MRWVSVMCLVAVGCNGDQGQNWSIKELVEFLNQKGVKCELKGEKIEGDGVTRTAIVVSPAGKDTTVKVDGKEIVFPGVPGMVVVARMKSEEEARKLVFNGGEGKVVIWRMFVIEGGERSELLEAIRKVLK